MEKTNKQLKVIQKVYKNACNDQKLITIPKDCKIEEGDYVEVIKL